MAVILEQAPRALIVKAPGTNCDYETQFAFQKAGALADIVPISQLTNPEFNLGDYHIITIPGGFSWGDHLGSGEVFAANLVFHRALANQLLEHAAHHKRPVLGICNGMQVLARVGLLPWTELTTLDKVKVSLAPNASGHFEHRWRWIHIKPEAENASVFQLADDILTLPVAHGEGRFYADDATMEEIERQRLVVFRYCDITGIPTQIYPDNPNGSLHAIAGICNAEGNVVALMPHPERNVLETQHPNWRRLRTDPIPDGLKIIKAIVEYAKQL